MEHIYRMKLNAIAEAVDDLRGLHSELCFLGNHSKPHDLSDCFIKELT